MLFESVVPEMNRAEDWENREKTSNVPNSPAYYCVECSRFPSVDYLSLPLTSAATDQTGFRRRRYRSPVRPGAVRRNRSPE